MLPGQEKAMKAYQQRKEAGHDARLNLVLLYEEGFQVGQGIMLDVLQQEKERCPICGNSRKKK